MSRLFSPHPARRASPTVQPVSVVCCWSTLSFERVCVCVFLFFLPFFTLPGTAPLATVQGGKIVRSLSANLLRQSPVRPWAHGAPVIAGWTRSSAPMAPRNQEAMSE